MKNRLVSLSDMIKLSNNPVLSESYIRYIRHQKTSRIRIFQTIGKSQA